MKPQQKPIHVLVKEYDRPLSQYFYQEAFLPARKVVRQFSCIIPFRPDLMSFRHQGLDMHMVMLYINLYSQDYGFNASTGHFSCAFPY